MNVLSLFDGMSCGQLALQRAGINVNRYFASEIEKSSISVAMDNHPFTEQLGSVTEVKGASLPKIDLLIGGSPCQGFSYAGKRLNFTDPRSALFFEFVRLYKETNPEFFLLENVLMERKHEIVITDFLGVEPIMLNSNRVSAQNRKRLYWTNINQHSFDLFGTKRGNIPPPIDRKIKIKDIIDSNKHYKHCPIKDSKTIHYGVNYAQYMNNSKQLKTQTDRFFYLNKKFGTLTKGHIPKFESGNEDYCLISDRTILERMQTIPDGYTNTVSLAKAADMLGNGWTVDIIAHIFSFIK